MSKRKRRLNTQAIVERKQRTTGELVGGLVLDCILALVPAVAPLSVRARWIIWFLCFAAFVFLLQFLIPPLHKLSLKWRILITVILLVAFTAAMWPLAHFQWREEMAAALEGDLVGAGPTIDDGKPHGFPMLQVGETTYVMTPNGVRDIFPFFPDSGVRIEWGAKGWPLLSTTVRDHNGNLVLEIIRNHWRIHPSYSAENNYTKDTLEVQDTAGHVVLQAQILPGKISLLGEWWDVQGNGVRLSKPHTKTPGVGSIVTRMNPQNQHLEALIEPIFEYPSKDHWGELRK